jgi:hypothetical protein
MATPDDFTADTEAGTPSEGTEYDSTLETYLTREALMSGVHGKDVTLIDSNLYSGSNDAFRTTMGGYYRVITDADGAQKSEFYLMSPIYPNPRGDSKFPISSIISLTEPDVSSIILTDRFDAAGTTPDTLVPHRKFVCAVDGDSSQITNDKHWKLLWTGGEINDVEVPAVYAAGSYDDHSIHTIYPYSAMEIRRSSADPYESSLSSESLNAIEISYKYSAYLPLFQAKAQEDFSELRLPNINLMKSSVYKSNRYDPGLEERINEGIAAVLSGESDESILDIVRRVNEELSNVSAETDRFAHDPKVLDYGFSF